MFWYSFYIFFRDGDYPHDLCEPIWGNENWIFHEYVLCQGATCEIFLEEMTSVEVGMEKAIYKIMEKSAKTPTKPLEKSMFVRPPYSALQTF